MRLAALGAALVALTMACFWAQASAPPERVPAGSWGGDHVSLEVTESGVTLEFDCAHGAITAVPLVDAEGRFDLPGVFVSERGGPTRDDQAEDSQPAVYTGRLAGTELTFSLRLTDEGTSSGPFTAVLEATPRLFKCQ